MERVDSNGERRPVAPSEIAQYDQMEAGFQELTIKILNLREDIKQAALDGDDKLLGSLTAKLDETIRARWDNPNHEMVNFMMHLMGMVEQAKSWTVHTFEAAEATIRLLASMQHPDHPIYQLPGFDPRRLDAQTDAVVALLNGLNSDQEFVTDTGVTMYNVHTHEACEGEFCVIHRPAPGPWDTWDTHWREDWKLMVRICPHDVHHVAIEERLRMPLLGMLSEDHPAGCDCPCDFARVDTLTDSEGKITGFRAKE